MRLRFSSLTVILLLLGIGTILGQASQSGISPGDPELQEHFAAAQKAQFAKDFATAEKEYRAILKLAPGFAEIHMNLGLIYQLQNRDPEAMDQFRQALKLKPGLTGANFFLGLDYCKQGNGTAAIPYLKEAVAQQSERADIWSWLATAQEMAGEIDAQLVTLRRALAIHPQNIDLLYLSGQAYEQIGRQEVASLKHAAPDSALAELLVAESYASSSEWPSAVIHFQNALAKSPKLQGVHLELGEVYLHAGKLKQANSEFDKELTLNPHSLRVLVRRGEIKLLRGEINDALHDWEWALEIDRTQTERILGLRETGFGEGALEQMPETMHPQFQEIAKDLAGRTSPAVALAQAFIDSQTNKAGSAPRSGSAPTTQQRALSCSEPAIREALEEERFSQLAPCIRAARSAKFPGALRFPLASALWQSGEYQSALQVLDALPVSQKRSPEATYLRARCYEKLATAAYLKLYQVDPNSYRVHQLMGDLAATRDDDGKAIEEYRAAVALNPNSPNLHYSLGHILWKDLKVPEARVELEAELKMNPHHAGALHDLGDTYLLDHQPDKALPYLNRAEQVNSADPDIHRDLGTAYSQLKDYSKAAAELKIGVAGDHDGSVHYKLAKVYQALGQKENAEHEFAVYSSMNRESHEKLEQRGQRLAEIERLAD